MNIKNLIIFTLVVITFAPAGYTQEGSVTGEVSAECPAPDKPSIPDGKNSTEAEMIEAHGQMQSYVSDGNAYLACIAKVEKGWGNSATPDRKKLIVVLHNKMVDEMNHVADMFNSSLRAFKGKK